jgi:alcohol dehydrogenase class IV
MMPPAANWNYPTAIRFGAGRIAELPAICAELGLQRPLLVIDPNLMALPIFDAAVSLLSDAAVFSAFHPNPVGADIQAGLAAYRAGAHDGVVAIGGGSALDVGKVVAFMSGQVRPIWDFEDIGDWWTRADPGGIAPVIAVPTTAGTGSEVGRSGVILDELSHSKKIIFHPKMMPAVVILDPGLTVGLPPAITAATGMDALSHALESWCAPVFHPMADGIALEAIRLIAEYLPRAYHNGDDLEARGNMLVAASMGATAFQKGLGAMHALAHPIGALFNTHHGLTNAVLMPHVLHFNRPVIEPRISRVAAYLGLTTPTFDGFMEWLMGMRRDLAIPEDLRALEVDPSRRDELAAMAENDPSAAGNPRKFDHNAAIEVLNGALGLGSDNE